MAGFVRNRATLLESLLTLVGVVNEAAALSWLSGALQFSPVPYIVLGKLVEIGFLATAPLGMDV